MSSEAKDLIISEFHAFTGRQPEVIASTCGRLDYLNTHQDYKGLPVVGVGIKLRTYVALRSNGEDVVRVQSGNLKDEGFSYMDSFNVVSPQLVDGKWFGNYFRACTLSLRRRGFDLGGVDAWVRSYVPIAAGLGSSATLTTSFIGALNELYSLGLKEHEIAEIAYTAEKDLMRIPCGRLDQYSSVFGNVILIHTRDPVRVELLSEIPKYFLVIDSRVKHSTLEVHSIRQSELLSGIRLLSACKPSLELMKTPDDLSSVSWEVISEELIRECRRILPERLVRRLLYTVKAHKSTLMALRTIRGEDLGLDEVVEALETPLSDVERMMSSDDWRDVLLGRVMHYQHKLLSNYYEVSLPMLDELVEFLLRLGAYGAKLSGAGLGGSVMALIKDREQGSQILRETLRRWPSFRGWVVSVDKGLRVMSL